MSNDSEYENLEAEIENQRASIAALQERVHDLVKRREEKTSVGKPEAIDELKRKIDTVKEHQSDSNRLIAEG
jgi:uncharacterized protein (UPF0305 family)